MIVHTCSPWCSQVDPRLSAGRRLIKSTNKRLKSVLIPLCPDAFIQNGKCIQLSTSAGNRAFRTQLPLVDIIMDPSYASVPLTISRSQLHIWPNSRGTPALKPTTVTSQVYDVYYYGDEGKRYPIKGSFDDG